MKRFSEQLHKQSETVKLQASEKRELRERLVSYMEYHPLPAELRSKKTLDKQAVKTHPFTENFRTFHIPFVTLFKSSAVFAAIVLVVLPFVAEKAVPGDTLYAMKVQFNEELRATLTFDVYQKVEWETERVNRRIAEARLLASEGRLTEKVEAEVAEAVRTHTESAQRGIDELRTQDADSATIASIALDTTLEVQSSSLRGKDEAMLGVSTSTRQNNLIANVIDQSLILSEAKSGSSTLPAYDKLIARAEQNTTRIYELLDLVRKTAPAEQIVDVTRRIQDIERAIQEAINLAAENDNEARLQLVGVLQRTQKLIVYMTELEVTNSVDIESLVLVVLTKTEEEATVNNSTKELDNKINTIQEKSKQLDDAGVKEKVDYALTTLVEQATLATTLTKDFKAFKKVMDEATVIADETLIIIEQHRIPVEKPVVDNLEAATTTATSTAETRASSTEGASIE